MFLTRLNTENFFLESSYLDFSILYYVPHGNRQPSTYLICYGFR